MPAGVEADERSADQATPTPVGAMQWAEVERTRAFARIITGLAVLMLATLPFIGGHTTAKWVFGAGIAGVLAACVYLTFLTSHPARVTARRLGAAYLVCLLGAFTGMQYFGVSSPLAGLIVIGLFFAALGHGKGMAAFLYAATAALQALLAGLVIGGVIPDYGLVGTHAMSLEAQIGVQVTIQAFYGATFLIARTTVRQSETAFIQLDRAVRAIAQREAMLDEARLDLGRALRIEGPGRYSEQTLGSYRLGAVIGRGAMGEVYEAFHIPTERTVAVKLLHPHIAARPDAVARMLREARAVGSLESAHVVQLLEEGSTGAVPFLVMERLRGSDLAMLLRDRGRLPWHDVIKLATEVGLGVQAAHEAKVIHRDLKPGNLFLAEQPDGTRVWKILDFGVSKLGDLESSLSGGNLVGTPMYMAPEQAAGLEVGPSADLYSLAAICYRAVTGHPPFTRKELPAILHEVASKMPMRPSDLANLSEDADRFFAIALAKDPTDRFSSPEELTAALADASRDDLDPAVRANADSLIARAPWTSSEPMRKTITLGHAPRARPPVRP